jgi:hypothetical protein
MKMRSEIKRRKSRKKAAQRVFGKHYRRSLTDGNRSAGYMA